jgi:hypothetical protein
MRRLVLASLSLFLVAGCKPKTPKEPAFDADAKSGPDGKRVGARSIRPNTPVNDDVNYQGQDQTDWFSVQLTGHTGVLTTELSWSNETSDLMVDVFDEWGTQLSASPPRSAGVRNKKLLAQIDKPGTYFLRVTAPNKTDGSAYSLVAKWDVPPEPVAQTEPEPPAPPPVEKKKKREPREPRPEREKSSDTVQGRVVSAYRDGDSLTLHIDKGSAAGVKPGMKGTVLSGASGEDALDGGEFSITQVLDANKSLAKTSLRSIGKNTRVVITLGH